MRGIRASHVCAVLLLVAVPACSGEPHDQDAELRPDLMRIEAELAAPGDLVKLHFPEQTPRGEVFAFERFIDGRWVQEYYLTARPEGGLSPEWGSVDEDYGWDDIGIEGPGPDLVEIPPPAEPGRWRVCTIAAPAAAFCGELTVRSR